MRRWPLALLVLLSAPALAQDAAPAAEAPAPAPVAPTPAPEKAPAAAEKAPAAPAQPAPAPRKPTAPPPAQAPAAAAPRPAASSDPDLSPEGFARETIQSEARFLFQSLLTGDVRSAASELIYPFQLEEKRFNTPEELVQTWVKQLRNRRTDLITLYDIEVLPIAEMEKKYGKPPARLGLDPRALKDTWAAVGNLSGHAAIFLFRGGSNMEWHAFAYTD
jgi:hypothetical protein